jgi:hypothetical protein
VRVAGPIQAQSALEYDVKAALLLNFTRFIEWPDAAFDGPRAPITVCVLAPSPFGQALDRVLSGETVADRPLAARQIRGAGESSGCHLLFVPAGAEGRAAGVTRELGPHTVTVGESRRFEDMGGAVNLVVEGGRIRFNVNLQPVEDRGVRISARMLQLASRVHRAAPQK